MGVGGIQAVTFFCDLPNLKKKYATLTFLSTRDHTGLHIATIILLQVSSDLIQTL